MIDVTCLKHKYSLLYGLQPDNIVTREQAQRHVLGRDTTSIVFGDPLAPELYMKIGPNMLGIHVMWPEGEEDVEMYLTSQMQRRGIEGIFLNEYTLMKPRHGKPAFDIFFGDAFVRGDFPRYSQRSEPIRIRAIAATIEPAFLGPVPSFDELCDGTFLARLPWIDPPAEDMLDPFIPQDQRDPPPNRPPRGQFPPGDAKRLPGGLAALTGMQGPS